MKDIIAKIDKIKNADKIAKNIKINIPSSKSYLNRALILSSIQDNITILSNVVEICDDTNDLICCLKKLGIKIEVEKQKDEKQRIIVFGNGGKFVKCKENILNCGLGGTTTRFLLALSALFDFDITITAEKKMKERPVGEIIKFLEEIGKNVSFLEKEQCLPVKITGNKIKQINKIELDCNNKSSQFLSAILLVANRLKIEEIEVKNLVSKSYVKLTIDVLKKFGIYFKEEKCKDYIVYKNITKTKRNKQDKKRNVKIEEDYSSASYFIALKEILGVKNDILELSYKSSQGDAKFIKIVKKIKQHKQINNGNDLTLTMENMPDVSMTAMILCSLCDFNTTIKGLRTLKLKECDRLTAMQNEFNKIGIKTEISKNFDRIKIFGNSKIELNKRILIETYNDHRIAMCFAILGAKIGHIDIKNAYVVNKSFRNFWQELDKFNCVKIV